MLRRAVRWCSHEQPDGGGCLDIPTTENNKPTPTGTGELGVPALGLGQGRASAAATIIASGFGQGCVAILALYPHRPRPQACRCSTRAGSREATTKLQRRAAKSSAPHVASISNAAGACRRGCLQPERAPLSMPQRHRCRHRR